MISNQILQTTVEGLTGITQASFCIIDSEGKILASTFSDSVRFVADATTFLASSARTQEVVGCTFFKVREDKDEECVLIVEGTGDEVALMGRMAVFQVQNLLVAYRERFDKDNFIKNLLLDNLLTVDIYNRAKKLHIDTDARRVVFLVESTREREGSDLEKIRALFGGKSKDFITAVDERTVVVVKDLADNEEYEDVYKTAQVILKGLKLPAGMEAHISYGTIVREIKDVSRSYKEARMALDVGKIFFEDRNINAYNSLGIGRLIYQLPIPLCKMFIKEILDGKTPEDFGEETMSTIDKFFENSLNVSETSRQLYIHRNTLVYRLDKLQKMTGLDLRVFEDAITFKIAMMVVKYMKHMENSEY